MATILERCIGEGGWVSRWVGVDTSLLEEGMAWDGGTCGDNMGLPGESWRYCFRRSFAAATDSGGPGNDEPLAVDERVTRLKVAHLGCGTGGTVLVLLIIVGVWLWRRGEVIEREKSGTRGRHWCWPSMFVVDPFDKLHQLAPAHAIRGFMIFNIFSSKLSTHPRRA